MNHGRGPANTKQCTKHLLRIECQFHDEICASLLAIALGASCVYFVVATMLIVQVKHIERDDLGQTRDCGFANRRHAFSPQTRLRPEYVEQNSGVALT
jgi:hypothetical protein